MSLWRTNFIFCAFQINVSFFEFKGVFPRVILFLKSRQETIDVHLKETLADAQYNPEQTPALTKQLSDEIKDSTLFEILIRFWFLIF
jgi:hypothetical protein